MLYYIWHSSLARIVSNLCKARKGRWFALTDVEFSQLIAQELPVSLPARAVDSWKRGFIFGWSMTWYYQPFLNEEAKLTAKRKRKRAKRDPSAHKPRD